MKYSSKFHSWEKDAKRILKGVQKRRQVRKVFFSLLDFIDNEKWAGACHPTAAIMFAIYRHLGLEPKLRTGNVWYNDVTRCHSWVDIDGKIYDASCYMQLGVGMSPPVLNHIILGTDDTVQHDGYVYGNPTLDETSEWFLNKTLHELFCSGVHKTQGGGTEFNTLWELLFYVADKSGIAIDEAKFRLECGRTVWQETTQDGLRVCGVVA